MFSHLFNPILRWIWPILAIMLSVGWGLSAIESSSLERRLSIMEASKHEAIAIKDAQIEAMLRQASDQRAEDEAKARAREAELVAFNAQLERRKNEQIDRLRADVRNLRYGLRELPSRPGLEVNLASLGGVGQDASGAETVARCPGPVLYREDGELLVDEAARAETIRLEVIRLYELIERHQAVTQNADQ